jgi:hypothetical protein
MCEICGCSDGAEVKFVNLVTGETLDPLRGRIRDRDGVAAFFRHRPRTGARQIWSVRLARAQKIGWRCRSTCGCCDTRWRGLRTTGPFEQLPLRWARVSPGSRARSYSSSSCW